MPKPTPQQLALESLYRKPSAKRPLGVKEVQVTKKLSRMYDRPSANKARSLENSRVSKSAHIKSGIRQAKVSTSANISKFNGGVKASMGATLTVVKKQATKQGLKGIGLGKLAASSKFLAGLNTVPGLALVVGNYVIWKQNLETLRSIYRLSNNDRIGIVPPQQIVINPGSPPPFTGGQSPGVEYLVRATVDLYNFRGQFHQRRTEGPINIYGPIGGISVVTEPYEPGTWNTAVRVVIEGRHADGSKRTAKILATGDGFTGKLISQSVVRKDGRPDTGGDPPPVSEAQVSKSTSTNSNITPRIPGQIENNRTASPPPPKSHSKPKASRQIPPVKAEFIPPEQLPSPQPNKSEAPTEELDKQQSSVSDNPPVRNFDATPNDVETKPETASAKLNKKRYKVSYDPDVESQKELKDIHKQQPTSPISGETKDRGWYTQRKNNVLDSPEIDEQLKVRKLDEFGNPVYWNPSPFGNTTTAVTPRASRITSKPAVTNRRSTDTNTELEQRLYPPVATRIEQTPSKPKAGTPVNPCKKGCGGATPSATAGNAGSNGLNTGLQAADLALVREIHQTVHSGTHGLAKIQGYAETAWKVTKADKIMNAVSMVMTVHNAMMLSNNLASTISEALNMSLEALNLRDEENIPIDIGNAVKSKIESVLKNILGEANYVAMTARIAKANRIYQSSINLLDTTYSLFDSARNIQETTAEYTGKIGNALREAGVVYEDAYEEMIEKISPQNSAMRRIGKFREAAESVEDVFDNVAQISGDVIDFKDTVVQLREEKQELGEEIEAFIDKKEEEKVADKEKAKVTAEVENADFDAAPPEE